MAIATRDWEEAVEQVEKGELELPSYVCGTQLTVQVRNC